MTKEERDAVRAAQRRIRGDEPRPEQPEEQKEIDIPIAWQFMLFGRIIEIRVIRPEQITQ